MDKLPPPYLSGSIPAHLTGPFQLPTPIIVICPVRNPTCRCCGCRFPMPHGMMTGHSSSLCRGKWHTCMTLSRPHSVLTMTMANRNSENLSSIVPLSHQISRKRVITSPWQRMPGNVDNLLAIVRAGVIVGRDGSNQRNTKSRMLLFGRISSLRGPAQVSGKKLLGEPRLPRIQQWTREHSQVIVHQFLFGIHKKKGEVVGANIRMITL